MSAHRVLVDRRTTAHLSSTRLRMPRLSVVRRGRSTGSSPQKAVKIAARTASGKFRMLVVAIGGNGGVGGSALRVKCRALVLGSSDDTSFGRELECGRRYLRKRPISMGELYNLA
jgi:hypothetical protein